MEDETSEYNVLKNNRAEWKVNLSSTSFFDTKSRHHQTMSVIQDMDTQPQRRTIPATNGHKLAYLRSYMTTITRLESVVMQYNNNMLSFVWNHLAGAFCKSLPVTYVHLFLSVYASDYHFFVSKMAPISYGSTFVFIGAAIVELYIMSLNVTLYMTHVYDGIYNMSPWNRCPDNETLNTLGYDKCYYVDEISNIFKISDNITFNKPFYVTSTGTKFQLPQVIYFLSTVRVFINHRYVFILWVLALAHYNQLYNSYVWKVLHRVQIVLNIFLLIIFVHLLATYKKLDVPTISSNWHSHQILMNIDVYFLLESLSSPPVIHFLNSRSANEGSPVQGSALIVISNATYYIFKGFVSYLLKNHCQNEVKVPLKETTSSKLAIFYFWTLYFSRFYMGDIYAIVFFGLQSIIDFYVFIITFQSFTEALAVEWYYMNKLVAVIFTFVLAILFDTFVDVGSKILLTFNVWTGVSTVLECLVVFWIYPVSRFIDDVYFHYGIPPSTMRKVTLMTVPFYYLIKIFAMVMNLSSIYQYGRFQADLKFINRIMIYIAILLVTGIVYSAINVMRKKQGFCQLFKPVPEWGPPDYHKRQLRKKFDSRKYIESQDMRELSRYIIRQTESKVYKVDIPYNNYTLLQKEESGRKEHINYD